MIQLKKALDAAPAGDRSPPASSTPPALTAVPTGMGAASLAALAGTWAGNTTRRINSVAFGRGALTLRIAPDGHYEYLHEAIDPGCSITRSATGTLSIAGGLLVMMPTRDHEHRVRHKPDALCTSGDTDLPLLPRRFKYDVQHVDWHDQASYQLSIWHDTEPSQAMMRLVPRPQAAAMPRPAALAEPGASAAGWMLGAWRAVSLPAPVWQLDERAGLAPTCSIHRCAPRASTWRRKATPGRRSRHPIWRRPASAAWRWCRVSRG
jgi:hypothetical protein